MHEIDFLDIDLETKEAKEQLKTLYKLGWRVICVEKSLHSDTKGRDYSRHLVIIERAAVPPTATPR